MKRIVMLFVIIGLFVILSFSVYSAELSDYMISDETIIANAPIWNNNDFPTSFIFYNESDGMYYNVTSISCCGYKDNAYINTVDNTFRLGNGSFRLYYWRYTNEWRYQNSFNSIDLSTFKLVSYNNAISKLYIDDSEVGSDPIISISHYILSYPTQTEYLIDESFNQSGFSITAHYNDGTSENITDKCSVIYPSFDGVGSYSLDYNCNDGAYSGSINITVVEIVDYKFTQPTSGFYNEGEELDLSGLQLIVVYGDGREVDVTSELIIHYPDNLVYGVNTFEVVYPRTNEVFEFRINIRDNISDEDDISNSTLTDKIINALKSVIQPIINFLSDWGNEITRLLVPEGDSFAEGLKERLWGVVDQIPIIDQIITIWKNVFNVAEPVTLEYVNDELIIDYFTPKSYFDEETQNRINQAYFEKYSTVLEEEGNVPTTYLFADPSKGIDVYVPVPFCNPNKETCGSSLFHIPTEIYSQELVNFDLLGEKVTSIRDFVFFFLNMVMWWNFVKLLTKFVMGLFTNNPLDEFVNDTYDKYDNNVSEYESNYDKFSKYEQELGDFYSSSDESSHQGSKED